MRRLIFVLTVLLAGCGGDSNGSQPAPQPVESTPPEISNLTVSPHTVTYMQGEGSIVATAQFAYVDPDIDIESMKVEMPDGTRQTISLGVIDTESGTLSEDFTVSTAELGTCTVQIWLVDEAGDPSNQLSADILVQSPAPQIASLAPAEVRAGTIGFDLSVTGTDFLTGAIVTWDGEGRATTLVSNTQVVASIPATDVSIPGTFSVRVRNPDPTAGISNALTFEVETLPTPEPTGIPVRITESLDGAPPDGPSVNGGLDWEGSHAVFASKASNLVAGDTNDAYDLFIRETCVHGIEDCTPTTTRAVMGTGGSEPNGDIGWTVTSPENSLAVSFNARFAAFVSSASNLVPDDTNDVDDIFLVDNCIAPYGWGTVTPTDCMPGVIRVSLRNDGSQSTLPASYPAVANDGRYVVFVSSDPNLVAGDTNGVADVFLRDTCRGAAGCTPSTTRVSVATNGGEANGASGEPAFTGRYVAFSSLASNLVTGDSNGVRDVFLRDTCIGEASCVSSTRLVSVGHLGDPADGPSSDPQVSWGLGDFLGHAQHGRFVAFVSSATNLVVGDTNGATDVFERDFCAGEPGCTPSTARISVTSTGGQIAGDSWSPDFLRWDGETIPFVTAADRVVPGDVNGLADVYLRHHCPFHSPASTYCVATTRRISMGADGAQTDGDSYAPRMGHCPFGAHAITYISEASNILPDGVPIPNEGSIYLDTAY